MNRLEAPVSPGARSTVVFPARAGMNRPNEFERALSVQVFPARAGMNRPQLEPSTVNVFPARAGMNRMSQLDAATLWSVPRPRGDEPVFGVETGRTRTSVPRPRGDEPNYVDIRIAT